MASERRGGAIVTFAAAGAVLLVGYFWGASRSEIVLRQKAQLADHERAIERHEREIGAHAVRLDAHEREIAEAKNLAKGAAREAAEAKAAAAALRAEVAELRAALEKERAAGAARDLRIEALIERIEKLERAFAEAQRP
jgi:predicted RNase H-like nuclease (RuvC/YqgF family)